jgi:hypothetical protein
MAASRITGPDETVPAGIPPAISSDELAAKKKWTITPTQESPNGSTLACVSFGIVISSNQW